jgi:hypothetical protein
METKEEDLKQKEAESQEAENTKCRKDLFIVKSSLHFCLYLNDSALLLWKRRVGGCSISKT